MLKASEQLRCRGARAALRLLFPLCVVVAGAMWSVPAFAAKEPVAAGATVATTDTCNVGAIDPNETVQVSFAIKNIGTTNIGTLKATLLATGGVTNPSGQVTVAGNSLNAGVTKTATFTFTAGNLACGAPLVATLALLDNTTSLGDISYNLAVGKPFTVSPYSSGNLAVAIPDEEVAGVDIPLEVPDIGSIAGVKVSVRLNHTFDGDLRIDLVHPDNTFVNLVNSQGDFGANFGSGNNDCTGTPTVLVDSASTTIGAGVAPFAGSFQPEEPLAVLNGKPSKGTWRLRVTDNSEFDAGTIGCFKLELQKAACCGAELHVSTPVAVTAESAVPANSAPDPGETVTVNFPLVNLGVTNTSNLVATLQASGGVTNPSGAQTYGALTAGGAAVTKAFTFTAVGACGGTLTATFALQDGATNLGTISVPLTLGVTQTGAAQVFADPTDILIPANQSLPDPGVANPYPASISVSGVSGVTRALTVRLNQFNHSYPSDVDLLLVSPTGQKMVIVSYVGNGLDAFDADLILNDVAASVLPDDIVSGVYRPTSVTNSDGRPVFDPPAPNGPYLIPAPAGTATLTAAFAGQNPNGVWQLYALDAAAGDNGFILGGWVLSIVPQTNTCSVPGSAPNPPTAVTATAGNAQASVSFTPGSDGGSPITGYTVTSNPAGGVDNNAGSTATTHTITGLTNGTAYTFTVTATNANGTSAPSTPSNSVTPATVPNAPTAVTATAGNAQASVSFTPPVNNGGSAITGYTVTSNPAGGTDSNAGTTGTTHTITGLTNGTAYTFTVTATNAKGTSSPSAPSNSVTPSTVPNAPTAVTATAGNAQASVGFTPPLNNGGSAITGYTVTSNPAGGTDSNAGTTGTTHVITGLTNGTAYTFTVHATNGVGNGPESAPSNSVTPSAAAVQTLTVSVAGSGAGTVASDVAGIACPGDCSETYAAGTPVTLTAMATGGAVFTGWLGRCTGMSATCSVTVNSPTAVSATFAAPGTVATLDIDLSAPGTTYDALTDGVLIFRYLFGSSGTALTSGALGGSATRIMPAISTYLTDIKPRLDIDGDGVADPDTDGLLVMRGLFGVTGDALTSGAIGPGAARTTPAQIQAYLLGLMP